MKMMGTLGQQISVCVAISLFHALFSPSNAATEETWYCTLQNGAFGPTIEAYQVKGDILRNLNQEKVSKEIFKDFKMNRPYYDFDIIRNDLRYLVANKEYDWNNGLNIETIIIEKIRGEFLSTRISTWAEKDQTESKRGVCTRGFD